MTAPVLSLDLGSARIGSLMAPHALPLAFGPDDAATIPVDARDLEPTVSGLAALLVSRPPSAVVVEHNPVPYMPPGKTPQAYAAIAAAHEVCSRLHERIWLLCREAGIPLVTIGRQTWAHRVCPGTKGGITDAMAAEGLRAHVDPTAFHLLADQDQRDAAGALVGWLLGPPKRKARERSKGPPKPVLTAEQRAANRRKVVAAYVKKESAKRAAERSAKGCNCGPGGGPRPPGVKGRHPRMCPAAPPPTVRGSRAAAEAYVPMTR